MHKRNLKDRLDAIEYHELGFPFDEGQVWERLEQRLAKKPVTSRSYKARLSAAAVLFLAGLSLPFLTLRNTERLNSREIALSVDNTPAVLSSKINHAESSEVSAADREILDWITVSPKSVELDFAVFDDSKLTIEPIISKTSSEKSRKRYSQVDLALIQQDLNPDNAPASYVRNTILKFHASVVRSPEPGFEFGSASIKLEIEK
ncbi:MAG: hypothetical protein AAF789_02345 [Bacteroidota bacterium]